MAELFLCGGMGQLRLDKKDELAKEVQKMEYGILRVDFCFWFCGFDTGVFRYIYPNLLDMSLSAT